MVICQRIVPGDGEADMSLNFVVEQDEDALGYSLHCAFTASVIWVLHFVLFYLRKAFDL